MMLRSNLRGSELGVWRRAEPIRQTCPTSKAALPEKRSGPIAVPGKSAVGFVRFPTRGSVADEAQRCPTQMSCRLWRSLFRNWPSFLHGGGEHRPAEPSAHRLPPAARFSPCKDRLRDANKNQVDLVAGGLCRTHQREFSLANGRLPRAVRSSDDPELWHGSEPAHDRNISLGIHLHQLLAAVGILLD